MTATVVTDFFMIIIEIFQIIYLIILFIILSADWKVRCNTEYPCWTRKTAHDTEAFWWIAHQNLRGFCLPARFTASFFYRTVRSDDPFWRDSDGGKQTRVRVASKRRVQTSVVADPSARTCAYRCRRRFVINFVIVVPHNVSASQCNKPFNNIITASLRPAQH